MVTTKTVQNPNLGLSEDVMQQAVEILATMLADEYVLRTKLRKYHWNVTGPQFHALHEFFEEQYELLAEVIDKVAERLRTYGEFAPGTLKEFIDLTRLSEAPGEVPDADEMVTNIVSDHEAMVRNLREDIETAAEKLNDVGLEDFLTANLQEHQEMAWMLRSFLTSSGI